MFNFERIVHKMSLIHDLTEFCDQEYTIRLKYNDCVCRDAFTDKVADD